MRLRNHRNRSRFRNKFRYMSTGASDNRPKLAPAVETLLGALRRRIHQYIWLEGCAAAVAWLGAAFWFTLAADWFFEPSTVVRGMMLAAVAAVFAAVVFRLIGRRIFVPITDGNAATVLERRFPELNDSLLTAVSLSDNSTNAIESDLERQMLAETCREAASRIEAVDLKKVFNPRPLWWHCSAATLLSFSVAFFAVLFPEAFGVWASRTLAMSAKLWPRSTRLEVVGFDDGVRRVARGSDVEVVVRADTHMPTVPETVEIRYQTEGGGRGRATMDRRGQARGPEDPYQEYIHTFRGVLADVRFDVIGGDDRKRDFQIVAVDSPVVSQMTLECELPAYIGRRRTTLPVTGVMQIPMGSRVKVHAAGANKELVGVQVAGIVGDKTLPPRMLDAGKGEIAEDRRGFSCKLEPLLADTTLLFTLTDTDGITSREPVRLVLTPTPDQPPQVAVRLDGIGTAVTPQARVAVAGRIADDYGIGRVWFERAIDQEEPGRKKIADLPRAPAVYALSYAGLEVREMGLKPGQKLLVRVMAADLCDLEGDPHEAGSERWALDIVTADQLRIMLDARELILRQRFERMLQETVETRDLLARLEFEGEKPSAKESEKSADAKNKKTGAEPGDRESGEAAADTPERRRDLRVLRVQGALTNCRKGAPEVLGVAEEFDDICKQLVNNRIDTEELKNRLHGGIAAPLHEIAEKMFPEFDRRLEELQAALDEAPRAPGLRDRALQQVEDILLAMRKVRDRMIELEDFNEAIDLLRNIVDMQKKLREDTQQRHKQKIRDLLKEEPK